MMKHVTFQQIASIRFYKGCLLAILCAIGFAATAQNLPKPDHIVVVIEENRRESAVIGNDSIAPYINLIAKDSMAVIFKEAYGMAHPSQPNYLHLFSGDNQGMVDNSMPQGHFTTPNLARELLDKGFTFATYSERLPNIGWDSASSNGYARKHNPVANWMGTGVNQIPDSLNKRFTDFPVNDYSHLPTISFVVACMDSDMHNTIGDNGVRIGDTWFHNNIAGYIEWARTNNSLLIFTFDEDEGLDPNKPNNIPTFFFGPMVQGGVDTGNYMNLHDMLRTMEDMYGLEHAGGAVTATPMTSCWKANWMGIIDATKKSAFVSVFPNPAASELKIEGIGLTETNYVATITDLTGKLMTEQTLPESNKLQINIANYPAGLYFYGIKQHGFLLQSGKVIITR